jgi:tight adherence protein B
MRVPRLILPSPWVVPSAAAAGIAAGMLALGLLAVPAAAMAIGLLVSAVPVAIDSARHRGHREAIAEAWPDLLALMSGRISAGSTLPDAFIAAARRTSGPLGAAVHRVEESVVFGDGFVPALVRLRPELDDPTSDRVLATLIFAQQSGGHRVGAVISSLGASISEELRVRRAHSAALTEQRMTATVALAAPWILLALTISTNPQAAIAYRTATGSIIIAIGFALTALGFLAARRSARLSRAPRVLQ